MAGAIGTAVVITIYTAQASKHAAAIHIKNAMISSDQVASLSSMLGSSDAYFFMTILAVLALVMTLYANQKSDCQPRSNQAR